MSITQKPHTHRAIAAKERITGWTSCVDSARCHASKTPGKAHGNIVCLDTCSCGATRRSEHNGGTAIYGPWVDRG